MSEVNIIRLALITADLTAGGAERVMATLANQISEIENIEVNLILLVKGKEFYNLHHNVKIYRPDFNYKVFAKPIAFFKTFLYLRKKLKEIQPVSYLSFGGRYNSFAILAGLGLKSRAFVSDRSRPDISYGRLTDRMNKFVYPFAYGIIAQTSQAKDQHLKRINHKNIRVIGNPIPNFNSSQIEKNNIILNVGRFIPSKKQELLVEYFLQLNAPEWELVFLGEGPELERVKKFAGAHDQNRISFHGAVNDVGSFYQKAKIFAFTSVSEGFPNSLGEAMASGLACISFDCASGPSDLIDHKINGELIQNFDSKSYINSLQKLIDNNTLIEEYGKKAREKMTKFSTRGIADCYLKFLLN